MKALILNWIKSFYYSNSSSTIAQLLENKHFQSHEVFWMIGLFLSTAILFALVWWLTKEFLLGIFLKFAKSTKTNFDDMLVEHKFFHAFAHLLPMLFLDYFFSIVFFSYPQALDFSMRFNEVLMVFVIMISIKRLMRTVGDFFAAKPSFKGKPINAYVQTINIVVSIILGIIMISLLTKQSPMFFLTSLGAMTAILLLVFKDAILGFVGSIQIASNDMVRIGDWVTMEKYGADGDVLEINLTTVKVQNFDKTITTIPTYAFVSDSFKNWRGMSDSGGRRIKRSVSIQVDSIKFASSELLQKLGEVKMISEFIKNREEEIKNYNKENNLSELQINARRQTNIGLFRRYLEYYLKHHKYIRQDMTVMVRQLEANEKGLPIEIYCFTSTVNWGEYEEIMSDIFDHIFSVVAMFELAINEQPTNSSLKQLVDGMKR